MSTLRPRVKASRVKRMLELSTLEKEARQIQEEFEEHKRTRRRLARRARKLAKLVRRRYPDMRIAGNDDFSLHDVVEDLAASLRLSNSNLEQNSDSIYVTSRAFEELFWFLRTLTDVPWLKSPEE